MDPKACLESAQEALDDGRDREARDFLRDYREWRSMGGFEPDFDGDAGDDVARMISADLRGR